MKDLIVALIIFSKYAAPMYPTICEHEVLYISKEINPAIVTEGDRKQLRELGFDISDDGTQFYSYIFGSA